MLIPLTGQLNLLPKSWLNVNPNPLLPRQLDFRTLSTVTCTMELIAKLTAFRQAAYNHLCIALRK
jgi:hypothetical protein